MAHRTKACAQYYRLLLLNLAVTMPLTVAILRHTVKATLAVVFVIAVALCVANYVITWKVARQGGTSSPEASKWGFADWCAWTMGPLITATFPSSIVILIVRRDFAALIFVCLTIYSAISSFAKVRRSLPERVDSISSS
jgi:hypothetical protein